MISTRLPPPRGERILILPAQVLGLLMSLEMTLRWAAGRTSKASAWPRKLIIQKMLWFPQGDSLEVWPFLLASPKQPRSHSWKDSGVIWNQARQPFPETGHTGGLPNSMEPYIVGLLLGNNLWVGFMDFVLLLHFCICWWFIVSYAFKIPGNLSYSEINAGRWERRGLDIYNFYELLRKSKNTPQSLRITCLKSLDIRDC